MWKVYLTYLLHGAESFLRSSGFAANQEIPHILWNPKVHYRTLQRPPPVLILSQLHPVPTTPSHFLTIHLNIILPSTSWTPQWSLSLRFPHQNLVHNSPLLHTCHMPRPSHSSRCEKSTYFSYFILYFYFVVGLLYFGSIYFALSDIGGHKEWLAMWQLTAPFHYSVL